MKTPNRLQIIPEDLVVQLRVLPQNEQRYYTKGDWLWTNNILEVRISREIATEDPRYVMLMFVHELTEALLCRTAGITAAQVDAFDMLHQREKEPGENLTAPYHLQHVAAEAAERALADHLGINWKSYLHG